MLSLMSRIFKKWVPRYSFCLFNVFIDVNWLSRVNWFLACFYSIDFILVSSQVLRNANLKLISGSFACPLGNLSVFYGFLY